MKLYTYEYNGYGFEEDSYESTKIGFLSGYYYIKLKNNDLPYFYMMEINSTVSFKFPKKRLFVSLTKLNNNELMKLPKRFMK